MAAVWAGKDSPCEVPDEPIVNNEMFFTSGEVTELWKLQGEVDRWLIRTPQAPAYALTLVDRETLTDAWVLRRGNPALAGEQVPRWFLEVLAGEKRQPFQQGSGRRELAEAIVEPSNPLTARVAVNRVWLHHFGAGLVRTPSDFGRRAETPSHPELLDWLAARFVEEGWSLKWLHRQIMLSSVYQQSSLGADDAGMLAKAQLADPENRWLWRMNTQRLSFEELRDAGLAVTGELNREVGGKASPLFSNNRRTLYAVVDRQFLPGVLRVFDFATPDLHVPQRSETIVPQQALFFMNHPFLLSRARALAKAAQQNGELKAEDRVKQMYRAAYQREPTSRQLAAALKLVQAAAETQPTENLLAKDWKYGFGEYQEEQKRVAGFKELPHFDGKAWQGGPKWPDAALGWVQVTAEGGHAGNDKQHAAVRRWTAPHKMTVKVDSELKHPVSAGDGVRGFLVSSRAGLLQGAEVHNKQVPFVVEVLQVEAGDTLDFVVDLRDNLNHEEFVWEATVTELPAEGKEAAAWNSRRDFSGPAVARLNVWEQLAQVLLAANEFMFVD